MHVFDPYAMIWLPVLAEKGNSEFDQTGEWRPLRFIYEYVDVVLFKADLYVYSIGERLKPLLPFWSGQSQTGKGDRVGVVLFVKSFQKGLLFDPYPLPGQFRRFSFCGNITYDSIDMASSSTRYIT